MRFLSASVSSAVKKDASKFLAGRRRTDASKPFAGRRPGVLALVLVLGLSSLASLAPHEACAHDLRIPVQELRRGIARLDKTLRYFRSVPAIPPLPTTDGDQRRALGAAEVELALGHRRRALEMLMGRLADARFQRLPEYVETLLLTSEILERSDEDVGAVHYAELALAQGGSPDQMAEAGARWFRLARRHQRLDRRLELYQLWRARGGEKAAGSEVAAEVAYEVGFALRADGKRKEARALLARVPSDSTVGSRAAYLAGVLFVEDGDLANAERWFSAIMEWPLPELPKDHPQMKVEIETRQLAALSAGRLRYERGDLEAADDAYRRIPPGSNAEAEACWDRSFLDLDRKRRRGALKDIQCVLDLGAQGEHHVNARLFRASLLAHLSRYGDSIESYEVLFADMERERDLFGKGSEEIQDPAEFLFGAMERNAVDRGRKATPGAPTLFGDAWTAEVDQAYRIDRGKNQARDDLSLLLTEIDGLTERLSRDDAFVVLEVRRGYLERVLREIQHLLGHAGDLQDMTSLPHASLGAAAPVSREHRSDADAITDLIRTLNRLAAEVERDITEVNRLEVERRTLALEMLQEIRTEVAAIMRDTEALEHEARGSSESVARDAIRQIREALKDAAMRAEVGVLDTYWLKKEDRTKEIEKLLGLQKESENQVREAMEGLFDGEPEE